MSGRKVIPFPFARGFVIKKLGNHEDVVHGLLRELSKALETLGAERVRITVKVERLDE